MRHWLMRLGRAEIWMLATIFAVAGLVLAFGHIADEMLEGDATTFDQTILLFSAPPMICPTRSGRPGWKKWPGTGRRSRLTASTLNKAKGSSVPSSCRAWAIAF